VTIEKEPPGLWFLTCDNCQERVELETDPDDSFSEAVKETRELGWRTMRDSRDTEWLNICPDCQRDTKQRLLKESGLG
jgi:hypothetical protein